jgi:hypothetical protein
MKFRVMGMLLAMVLMHWAVGVAAQTPTVEGAKACACCQHTGATGVAGASHDHAAKACCADCSAAKGGKTDCCKGGSADCCKSGEGCCGGKDAKTCAAKEGKGCCAGDHCKTAVAK